MLLGRLVGFVLDEGLKTRGLGRGVHTAIARTATYAVIAVGTVLAVLASGTELTRLTVLIGTLGVGIGFGLQDVVNNFVSGLILLYERPVQVGDYIEVGEVVGSVRRIGIRSSTVYTDQGSEVVVPNSHLISNEVTNWTLSDRRRRTDIDVSVAEATSPERARELLLQVARAHPEVLKSSRAARALRRLRRQRAELPAPECGHRRRSGNGWRASCAPPSVGCWARPASTTPRTRCTWRRCPRPCRSCSAAGERRTGRRAQARRNDPGDGRRSY